MHNAFLNTMFDDEQMKKLFFQHFFVVEFYRVSIIATGIVSEKAAKKFQKSPNTGTNMFCNTFKNKDCLINYIFS
jgi:hypothetical protein